MDRRSLLHALAAVLVGLAIWHGHPATAQESPSAATRPAGPPEVWKVATRNLPPFVIAQGRDLSGFSIDLWRAIAAEIGIQAEFVVVPSLPDLLSSVREGRTDIAIGAISITAAREESFDFSVPMFESGLQVAVPAAGRSAVAGLLIAVGSIVGSRAFLEGAGLLLLLLLVPSFLLWFFERRHEDGMIAPGPALQGFGASLFWILSALAGQAEEMPRSLPARLIAVVWIFAAIALLTWFTASLTAAMTVENLKSEIAGPQDLPGKRIGTVEQSTSAAYLGRHLSAAIGYPTIEKAYDALGRGEVSALVYDAPVLRFFAAHDGRDRIRTVGPIFRKESYGILFQSGDARRKRVNAVLLRLRESGRYEEIYDRWFGFDPAESR